MSYFSHDDTTLGMYFPGFFTVHIKTSSEDLRGFSLEETSTYMHEYIHYMQNITTANGINRFIFFSHMLGNIFSLIDKCKKFNKLYKMYIKMRKYNRDKQVEYDEFLSEIQQVRNFDYNKKEKIINIFYDDKEYAYIEYSMGKLPNCKIIFNSNIIYEGMAKIIQNAIFKEGYSTTPYFPYLIVQDVSHYYFGNRLSDNELVQLCDFSLQTTRPGVTFINVCEQIKNGKSINELWNDDIGFSDLEKKQEYMSCKIENVCDVILKSNVFQEIFQTVYYGETRKDIANYLLEIFSKGASFRRKHKQNVFSNLMNIKKENIFNELHQLHTSLGMPNTFDIYEKRYFGSFSGNLKGALYLPVMKKILDSVLVEEKLYPLECPFRYVCLDKFVKYSSIYDFEVCKSNFVKDINKLDDLCFPKSLAFSMGFSRIDFN